MPAARFSFNRQSQIVNRKWYISLVGRGVNIRDGHALAENVDLAGLLREIIAIGDGAALPEMPRDSARCKRAVFERGHFNLHRGGQRVAEKNDSRRRLGESIGADVQSGW